MAVFETTVQLAATAEEVFDFLAQPKNVELLAPPGTEVTIIDAPEIVAVGSFVEFEVAGLGPKQRMVHEITAVERPHRIVEQQYEGPFGSFEHTTELQDTDGTLALTDRITFDPPTGLMGFLITEKRIRSMLAEGYAFRQAELQRRFGGD